MAAMFHVFVEGAMDATPAGMQKLAQAIAQHYGLPAADLLARLQKGRFRVKGNIDRELADKYCRDLERLGARCVVEAANAQSSAKATPLPFPAVRPATPPAGVPAAGAQQYQSGLAAAFSGEMPSASLGALENEGAAFALSTVDGADDKAASAPSFEPPAGGHSASIGPAPDKPKAGKADKPKDVPLDLFAPPEAAAEAAFKVDLADDEPDPRNRASTPSPVADEAPARKSQPSMQPPSRKSQPSLQAPHEPVAAVVPSKLGPLGDARVRFAAGVVVAVLLGFVPAHFVAAMREKSAYAEIDQKVMAAQQLADTPEAYATIDKMRADQLDRKEGEQRNAALIAFAIWALVGAGVAFVWFKKIPWDSLE